jgi:hypothetical protein
MAVQINTLHDFSRVLVETGEIDPSYVMLCGLRQQPNFGDEWVKRFCVAYLLFYHTGTAARAAEREGAAFWRQLESDWHDTTSRGTERRHFRGAKAWETLQFCSRAFDRSPELMFDAPREFGTYKGFHTAAKRVPQFGDYFIWKWNDFSTCVFDDQRDMAGCEKFLPSVPREGLQRFWPDRPWRESFDYLTDLVRDIPEQFRFPSRRACGAQEAETIACSLKGYVLDSPPTDIGHDIEEKQTQLKRVFGVYNPFARYLPAPILPNAYRVNKNAVLESARLPA